MLLEQTPEKAELEDSRRRFQKMQAETDYELISLFKRYDASEDRAVLQSIRGVLNRRRYIQNLVRDVEKALAQ
jgi:molecular chaperone HscB